MNRTNRAKEKRSQMLSYIQNACATIVLGASLSALLAACGGGDGHTGASLSGKVMDGYIGGATVCLSAVNPSFLNCDPTIPSVKTDSSGNYSISFPSSTSMTGRYVIAQIVPGNTDTDAASGVLAAYDMAAPAQSPSVVSPLTTMVSANMLIYPASGIAAAQASVASSVGIPAGSLASDYIANSNGGYHNVARLVAALLTSAGAPPTIDQAHVNALFTAANSGASAALNATNATQLNAAIATAQSNFSVAGGSSGTITFASAFNITANTTTNGGTLGGYTWAANGGLQYNGGDTANPTNSSYFYLGYNFTAAPSVGDGFGVFVAAPGNTASNGLDSSSGLVVTGATNLVIPIAADQKMLTSHNGSITAHIILQGKVNKYLGNCTVLVSADQTILSATATPYTIPLSNFTLGQACGQTGITTVASALADGVAEIHVQALTGNLNTTLTSGGFYPNGLALGSPIQFTAPSSNPGGTGSLAVRPLPSIYTSGTVKAINYSGYLAGGPPGEVPSNASIDADLQLLSDAGYTLLRLFDTDTYHENILKEAALKFPNLKFQLGIYLQGLAAGNQATCTLIDTTDTHFVANITDVNNGIREANTYSNVVSVSLGNETSFFYGYMPVHCLAGYITTVKQSITQPVTADDDWKFYAGISGYNNLDGTAEIPDLILPLLDFVSIHTYPMSNPGSWTSTGTGSAATMMTNALNYAKFTYSQVQTHIASLGYSNLPIVIGETGWKATQTNPGSSLEACCANPVNAKMYYDSMNTWQGLAGTGPKDIFYFEAFDETWKGVNVTPFDDGWGLWDINRNPRYALCGITAVPSAPTCNATIYSGATFAP